MLAFALLISSAAWAGPPFHALDALPSGELVLFDPAARRIVRWDGATATSVADVPGSLAKEGHLHNVWVDRAGAIWVTATEGPAWKLDGDAPKRERPPADLDVDDPCALLPAGGALRADPARDWDVVLRGGEVVYTVDDPLDVVTGLASLRDGGFVVLGARSVRIVAPDGTVADAVLRLPGQVIGAAEDGAGALHLLTWASGGVVLWRVGDDGQPVERFRTP
jgi:hypothetical protein